MKQLSILLFVLFFFAGGNTYAQTSPAKKEINPADTFPVPKQNKDMLFYIQRTHNKNTIVYELNYNTDSTLNEDDPVKIYWIRYSDKGEIAPLSYIQRKYAYGVEAVMEDTLNKSFKLNFVSYKNRTIYLSKSKGEKQYSAFIFINGKIAYLSKVFVKIDGGTFWVPHITYVELMGVDVASGKKVTEKIIP